VTLAVAWLLADGELIDTQWHWFYEERDTP
jgi:hypothetical protein